MLICLSQILERVKIMIIENSKKNMKTSMTKFFATTYSKNMVNISVNSYWLVLFKKVFIKFFECILPKISQNYVGTFKSIKISIFVCLIPVPIYWYQESAVFQITNATFCGKISWPNAFKKYNEHTNRQIMMRTFQQNIHHKIWKHSDGYFNFWS